MRVDIFYKSFFGLVLLFGNTFCFSQKATRQYVDSSFKMMNSSYKQNRDVFYVINGVPFDTSNVDKELALYELKYLMELQFLTCEQINTMHCRNDVALIFFAYNQKNKKKQKMWKSAKELFKSSFDTPYLLIDNAIIDNGNAKNRFNSFRLKDIMYIDMTLKDNKHFVRIWTAN
ncbi:MAG TPA: hypothetical protein PKO16_07730 [Bacteroidia bacterium]|nr:hypothetical protein [Bacteroidia bacterium]